VDLPAANPGVANHYSIRTNPDAPDLDTYRPAQVDGSSRGTSALVMKILVRHTFTYEG
jgi:hypothetical protein